jgi:hypothetical protein
MLIKTLNLKNKSLIEKELQISVCLANFFIKMMLGIKTNLTLTYIK